MESQTPSNITNPAFQASASGFSFLGSVPVLCRFRAQQATTHHSQTKKVNPNRFNRHYCGEQVVQNTENQRKCNCSIYQHLSWVEPCWASRTGKLGKLRQIWATNHAVPVSGACGEVPWRIHLVTPHGCQGMQRVRALRAIRGNWKETERKAKRRQRKCFPPSAPTWHHFNHDIVFIVWCFFY